MSFFSGMMTGLSGTTGSTSLAAMTWPGTITPRARLPTRLAAGAWGCSLSGAGPTVFAVAEAGAAPAVGEALRRAWAGAGVACEIEVCVLDRRGARVLEQDDPCG